MKTHQIIAMLLIAGMVLSGCTGSGDVVLPRQEDNTENGGNGGGNGNGDGEGGGSVGESEAPDVSDISVDDPDDDVDNSTFSKTLQITFSGTSATVTGEVEDVSAVVNGARVTVTSTTKEVEYILSGTAANGYFKIYSTNKFKLTLDGVSITNTSGPAVNIQSGKRCFVVLSGASNLADGGTYAAAPDGEDQKACLFSEGQLIFSGTGTVNIKGNNKHGICSDDYVRIRQGVVNVTGASSDGIHTNDAFIMDGGTLSVVSSSDGIECEEGFLYVRGGTVTVNAGDDGIVTSYEDGGDTVVPNIYLTDGYVTVNTTAQKGHALKSTGDILISGGTHTIRTTGAAAKGINADGNSVVSGGTTTITTSGITIVENSDTTSAAGVKAVDFGMTGGTLTITSSGNGGKGINTDGNIVIEDGSLSVTTTGAEFVSGSYSASPKAVKADGTITIRGGTCVVNSTHEGIESPSLVAISGGKVEVAAADDAINVSNKSGSIKISGGNVYAYSSGNDGIDSNGTIYISGGLVVASGTSSPEEGIDCDSNTFSITGGTIIATGGATSYPNVSSGQHAIVYGGSGTSGQYIQLKDSSGEELLAYKLPRTLSSMTMVLSHPGISKSSSYTLTRGGTYSGGTDIFHGYSTGGTFSGGTATAITTGSSAYTSSGSSSGGGGNPGGGGRP